MAVNRRRVRNDVSSCCWFDSKSTQNEMLRATWVRRVWRNKKSSVLLKYRLGKPTEYKASFRPVFKKFSWRRWIAKGKRIASVIDLSLDGIATWESTAVTQKLCSLWFAYCLNTWIFKVWLIETLKEAQ